MITLTVLYGRPDDPAEFERYYAEHHMPLVEKLPGLGRHEAARCISAPDGDEPAFYRMFTAWFESVEQMHQVLGSEQGQVVTADVPNFASGGATMVVSGVDAG